MTTKHETIGAALAAAARAVKPPEKSGRNAFHNYAYTTAEEMLDAVRGPLAENGLVAHLVGQRIGDVVHLGGKHKDGTDKIAWRITFDLALSWDGGDGLLAPVEYVAFPEAGRPLDKAINAAATNSLGYWLRSLLMVPRGMGDSIDGREDREDAAVAAAATARADARDAQTARQRQQRPTEPRGAPEPPDMRAEIRRRFVIEGLRSAEEASEALLALGGAAPSIDQLSDDEARDVLARFDNMARTATLKAFVAARSKQR